MRTLLGCMLAVSMGGWLGADDKKDEKVDAQKLIGKWEHEAIKDIRFETEFTKDNKVTMFTKIKSETDKTEGTYKLDGAKLEITLKKNGQERTDTSTILKLTDTELSLMGKEGQKITFTRVKSK